MKMALMVIDLQKAYLNENTGKSIGNACEYINAAIPMFRKNDCPIIWIQNKDENDGSMPGKVGFEFVDILKPDESDYRIIKEYGNAFNKTDCLKILEQHKVDTIILTGYCAEYCVLSTYRGAQDLDLTPIILRNSLASDNAEHVKFVETISDIVSIGVLAKIINDKCR